MLSGNIEMSGNMPKIFRKYEMYLHNLKVAHLKEHGRPENLESCVEKLPVPELERKTWRRSRRMVRSESEESYISIYDSIQ